MPKQTSVTATGLGRHLDLSLQRVMQLVEEGIIPRRDDGGFDQDECRIRYINFIREDGRRAKNSAENVRLNDAKAKAIEIRNARADRQLIEVTEAIEFVDSALGGIRADFTGFAARVTRDLRLRRKIEDAIDDVFRGGAERMAKAAKVLRDG